MATYLARTTSNSPKLSDPNAVAEILSEYETIPHHGELTLTVRDGCFSCFGEAEFLPYRPSPETDSPVGKHDNVDQRGFLEDIAPYLESDLIIQQIGQEKLRYPFTQSLFMVHADTETIKIESANDRARSFFKQVADEPIAIPAEQTEV